jgi:hypothetical protein
MVYISTLNLVVAVTIILNVMPTLGNPTPPADQLPLQVTEANITPGRHQLSPPAHRLPLTEINTPLPTRQQLSPADHRLPLTENTAPPIPGFTHPSRWPSASVEGLYAPSTSDNPPTNPPTESTATNARSLVSLRRRLPTQINVYPRRGSLLMRLRRANGSGVRLTPRRRPHPQDIPPDNSTGSRPNPPSGLCEKDGAKGKEGV